LLLLADATHTGSAVLQAVLPAMAAARWVMLVQCCCLNP
jgi:hypothetical protein